MNVLFHYPNPDSIYAMRTIYNGYKNAFTELGHSFYTYTQNDNLYDTLTKTNPDLLITFLSNFHLKGLDLDYINKLRKQKLNVAIQVPFWESPISNLRINEVRSLKSTPNFIKLLQEDNFDILFSTCEMDDARMEGFSRNIGREFITIPLAADKSTVIGNYQEKFQADISYIGTYLPEKREFFKGVVFPLKNKYNVKLYGQDWTLGDSTLGWIQRFGQYFNIPYVKSIRKPKLVLGDEANIYKSSIISINVHERYQKTYGGDCNERTFKIPLAGGFEITDDVSCISKYFIPEKEIVIAKNDEDYIEKIEYYLKNPDKRISIIENGYNKVLKEHTYHNRAKQFIDNIK